MAATVWAGINHSTGQTPTLALANTSIAASQANGLRAVRMGMDGISGATPTTAFNFVARDAVVNAYATADVQIHAVCSPWLHTDKSEAAWRRFVRTTMGRYGDRIKYWIIGDEPDEGTPRPATPAELGNWMRWAREERDALQLTGKCLIESPPVKAIDNNAGDYFDQMIDAGCMNHCDVVGVHLFGGQIADDRIVKTWQRMVAKGVVKPLGVSEGGMPRNRTDANAAQQVTHYPPGSSATNLNGTYPGGQDKWRANFYRQMFVMTRAVAFEYVLLFDLSGTTASPDGNWSLGTIAGTVFTPHPLAWAAIQETFGSPHPFANGGFEQPEDSFGNWFVRHAIEVAVAPDLARVTFPTDAAKAHTGNKYLAMTLAGHTSPMVVRQVVDGLTVGNAYRLKVWAFIQGAGQAVFRGRGFDNLDGQLVVEASTSTPGAWVELTVDTPAIKNPWIVLELRATGTNTAGHEVRWDDASVSVLALAVAGSVARPATVARAAGIGSVTNPATVPGTPPAPVPGGGVPAVSAIGRVLLLKRGGGPVELTANDFDANMGRIEDAFAAADAILARLPQAGAQRYVDLRDFTGVDFAGNNDCTIDVNAALLQAYAAGYPCHAPAGSLRVSTVRLPSRIELKGAGIGHTRLLSTGVDAPILASKNTFDADDHPIQGRTRVHHLSIVGSDNQALAGQHGILFRDYFSELSDLEIRDTGGSAIRAVHTNDAGVPLTSTLVNNRFLRLVFYNIRGETPLFLGAQDNISLTDGHLHDVYLEGYRTAGSAGGTQVYVGHAAGWSIRNVHAYVAHPTLVPATPNTAMHLYRPWNCRVADLYFEDWTNNALYLQAMTGVTEVTGLRARADKVIANASLLYVDRIGATAPVVLAANLLATKDGANAQPFQAITVGDGARVNTVTPPTVAGARAADMAPNRKLGTGALYIPAASGLWAAV